MPEAALLAGAALTGLALGLWWGERLGARAGYRLGQAAAPLGLRQESLARGRCVLCNARPEEASETEQAPPLPDVPSKPEPAGSRGVDPAGED